MSRSATKKAAPATERFAEGAKREGLPSRHVVNPHFSPAARVRQALLTKLFVAPPET
jgi:hypothetical protein